MFLGKLATTIFKFLHIFSFGCFPIKKKKKKKNPLIELIAGSLSNLHEVVY